MYEGESFEIIFLYKKSLSDKEVIEMSLRKRLNTPVPLIYGYLGILPATNSLLTNKEFLVQFYLHDGNTEQVFSIKDGKSIIQNVIKEYDYCAYVISVLESDLFELNNIHEEISELGIFVKGIMIETDCEICLCGYELFVSKVSNYVKIDNIISELSQFPIVFYTKEKNLENKLFGFGQGNDIHYLLNLNSQNIF